MHDLVGIGLGFLAILVAIAVPLMIEAKRRPVLRIERADDLNDVLRTPNRRIVHVRVVNEPMAGRLARWLLRNTATGCRVSITFKSTRDGRMTGIAGRWSGAPEPYAISSNLSGISIAYDLTKVPQTLRMDVESDPEGEVLGIALKSDGDQSAYGFTSESYGAGDLKLPQYELPDKEYEVVVTARAGGISKSATFALRNSGTTYQDLTLVEEAEPMGHQETANPDPGVRLIVRVITALEWLIAYEWLCEIDRLCSPKLAYYYVAAWTAILVVILATSGAWDDAPRWIFLAMTLIPAYRMFDLLRWYADFLLDKAHSHVMSTERNIVFVVANIAETALIGAIWLRASGQALTPGGALFDSFTLVAQLGLPEISESGWAKVGVVMTEITALTLLLGGVAVLIAEIQEKVESSKGEWRGRGR